jgi:flagellar biosynthetic protein FlhB
MQDRSQQTEKPTERRLEKARKEGRFAVSPEFAGGLQFLAFVAITAARGPAWFSQARYETRRMLAAGFAAELTPGALQQIFEGAAQRLARPLLEAGFALAAITLAAQLSSTQFGISVRKLVPDFARLNPAAHLRELPKRNIPRFFQALVLLPLFGAAVWEVAGANLTAFARLPFQGVESGVALLLRSVEQLLWKAALLFVFWGAVDLYRSRARHARETRMSKQEIRDESRESEGNPQVKGRIRRLQRDLLRRRMMSEVPKATAVIVNPTHYAVAIRYQMESAAAPVVVAKGKNYLALRIRRKAVEHQIPVIENVPLAQALYKSVEVGREIPSHLFRAVAEVLAYIFKLTGRRVR